ncbi:hypothetical protein D3C85_845930 [compost metagenome]
MRTSAIACARLLPMAPSKARPASAVMKGRGKTMNRLARVTPKTPTRMYSTPHARPAT